MKGTLQSYCSNHFNNSFGSCSILFASVLLLVHFSKIVISHANLFIAWTALGHAVSGCAGRGPKFSVCVLLSASSGHSHLSLRPNGCHLQTEVFPKCLRCDLSDISGHPSVQCLVMEALRQWLFSTTLVGKSS